MMNPVTASKSANEVPRPQPTLSRKPRLAVVTPFLEKSHGTERMVIEWITRLAHACEIHIYTQRTSGIDTERFIVHRIPKLPGPHLFNFLWWFAANRLWRYRDSRSQQLEFDLIYSPGTNCLDADVVTVHIVFAEFLRRVRSELEFRRTRVALWPRLVHRRLYYRLVMFLERRVFLNPKTQLVLTAPQSAKEIEIFFGRKECFPVLSPGIDHASFNPSNRKLLRQRARESLKLQSDRFVLLLIGNDWRKKGLGTLLDSLVELRSFPVDLLVVGRDDPASFLPLVHERSLEQQVHFLPVRDDVEFYYAAADAYAGPSLEDTFALPASEAMACGLPVIISARAGAAAMIRNGVDGLILNDPTDSLALAELIRGLCVDRTRSERLGQAATATAGRYTWDRSADELFEVFSAMLERKGPRADERV